MKCAVQKQGKPSLDNTARRSIIKLGWWLEGVNSRVNPELRCLVTRRARDGIDGNTGHLVLVASPEAIFQFLEGTSTHAI